MRILVASDTHGNEQVIRRLLLSQPEAQVLLHLGDGADEALELAAEFPDRMILAVKGNCDYVNELPLYEVRSIGGKRIFFTHGHTMGVKFGLGDLIRHAKKAEADIALFGHTHTALVDYAHEIHIMNPGTLGGVGAPVSYGIIDISDAGVFCDVRVFPSRDL